MIGLAAAMDWPTFIGNGRKLIGRLISDWARADCTTQAAAVSFFAALSLFPFIIVLISGVGFFFDVFESGQNAEEAVLRLFAEVFSAEMSASVDEVLTGIQDRAHIGGPIAFLVLLYLASRIFTQIDAAFGHIWDVRGDEKDFRGSVKDWVLTRFRAIALIGGFGAMGLFVFYGSTILYAAETFLETWFPEAGSIWGLRIYLFSIPINALAFGGLYRVLSKGPVRSKLCFGTGLLVALLWEMGRIILANLVIAERYTALGVVGSFLGILLWIFYNVLALLGGAVLIRTVADGADDPSCDAEAD